MSRIWKLCCLLLVTMLLTACAGGKHSGEKIAVVEWTKVVAEHPLQAQLKQGEKHLKELIAQKKAHEKLAKTQLSSLGKLQSLKDISQKNYLQADFNTHMAERHAIEQEKLIAYTKKVGQEGDALIEGRCQEIEKAYQLEIFNLQLQLETLKMKPEERKALEKRMAEAKARRGQAMASANAEKEAYIQSKLQPYVAEMQKRLGSYAAKKTQENKDKLAESAGKNNKLLEAAPSALKSAFSIMDREIEQQQAKNDALKKRINKDIESLVIKFAKERGYTIVFNTFKVNVKAEDITQDVIAALKKQNK